ncbi:S-formylglutathione hydrolase [Thiobaca trueperi]|uniref:S-formylglutathione hydrolase n=1 Tax=Thiobaca trueperi TaxID=127458 RepID=A0A4R3N522_9GAMM|nr:S-formylglutathione hydrolase [Thiobaca trueperi]TCT24115.1 S-formylglutathione hydrolase [Thiobaca trueperi]
MERIERIREFGGWLERYRHDSETCHCPMTFSVYLPPQAESGPVPAVYFLSGLTCTDDNVRVKAGAQRYAAELGLALVMPDTSPRGETVSDAPDRYDLGQGAGFYVNASRPPWATHYRMFDYANLELPALVERALPLRPGRRSITGHSMGGHGALISALRNPGLYRSVSAFAPICNPVACGWGQGCLGAYLGDDPAAWKEWDATELIRAGATPLPLLIDQGTDDEFLAEGQLRPEALSRICAERDVPLTLRMQPGYDHSYHFIATFIGEHLAYHARALADMP